MFELDQFQFDQSSITSEEKLDDLFFSESPSSPSSDELLTLPVNDLLNPADTFILPSIFTEPLLTSPETFSSSISLPYSIGKRTHEATLDQTKPRSHKGKKMKTDTKTKRERNKVSAAKYRQRRKVYIDGLEDHVRQLNEKLEAQSKTIASLKTENQMLKDQLSYLKKLVDSFRCGKTPVQSVPPINRSTKIENTFGHAMKPMGAGLFLLAICCLVFSFQSFSAGQAPIPSLPVRSASRTLLHHVDDVVLNHDDVVLHHDDDSSSNDSTPFVSIPLDSNPEYPSIDGATIAPVVDINVEPSFEEIESIVSRHSFDGAAAAAA
jgi:cell division protein FtsB